jgi:hypothetical protein
MAAHVGEPVFQGTAKPLGKAWLRRSALVAFAIGSSQPTDLVEVSSWLGRARSTCRAGSFNVAKPSISRNGTMAAWLRRLADETCKLS